MTADTEKQIENLIAKAAQALDSSDAMRYSQAALNAANTAITLDSMKRTKK